MLMLLPRENAFRWFYESDASTKEKRTSMLYFGGVTLFAVGYGCFGMGYAFSWDNEQEGGEWRSLSLIQYFSFCLVDSI